MISEVTINSTRTIYPSNGLGTTALCMATVDATSKPKGLGFYEKSILLQVEDSCSALPYGISLNELCLSRSSTPW
jgi:hypothetical protein